MAIRDTGSATLPDPVSGLIQFESVSFNYSISGAGVSDISLTIPAGTSIALVGATGSGKSTLVKLLLCFYEPASGQIRLDGVPLPDLPLATLRNAIGLVSQDIFLFDGTIGDNIAYGRPGATQEQISTAAKAAEAWEFIEKLPSGLDTEVGERGVRLSGGQRQRLSLARALIKNPPVLILNEATSAVDNETEAAIQRSLTNLSIDRTVIVIAHRLSTIVHSHRVVVLEDGGILETGTHTELLSAGGEYARQWAVQTGGER